MLGKVSLTALLQERATRQPDATAYTFIDYELDPNGLSQSLTWAQLHRRAQDSGKVRRSACTKPHRQNEFERVDAQT
jgi:acyl-CoA synthetase (AMP-forming)/AMP-acid ligase II